MGTARGSWCGRVWTSAHVGHGMSPRQVTHPASEYQDERRLSDPLRKVLGMRMAQCLPREQASSSRNPVHGIAQRSLLTPSIAASQPAFPRSPQAGWKPLAARDSHGESASAQQPRILGRLVCVEKRLCGTPGLFSRPVSTKVCSRHLFVRAVGLGVLECRGGVIGRPRTSAQRLGGTKSFPEAV